MECGGKRQPPAPLVLSLPPTLTPPLPDPAWGGGVRPAPPCGLTPSPAPTVPPRGPLRPALPCVRGPWAPAPLPCAPLGRVMPRDQRTGISVTLMYIKEWNQPWACCADREVGAVPLPQNQGWVLSPSSAGGSEAQHRAGTSSPCPVPSAGHQGGSCRLGPLGQPCTELCPVSAELCPGHISASSQELPPGCGTNWASACGMEPAWDSGAVKARHLNEV